MRTIAEPARETPVVAETDVIVAGAGPAGLGAAIAAARAGARVMVIEKHGCLGGMMTAGSVLNIRQYTDKQKQVIGGVAAEWAERLYAAGGASNLPHEGLRVHIDPEIAKYVAQEWLLAEGVRFLLHSPIVEVVRQDDTVRGVIIENKGGRSAVLAPVTIDCTGDGDVVARSGAAYASRKAADLQPMTLTFLLAGHPGWPAGISSEVSQKAKAAVAAGTFPASKPPTIFATAHPGVYYLNATRIPGDCTNPEDLTHGEIEGRRQAKGIVDWLRANAPGFENSYMVATPPQVGLRESRRLAGVYELTRDDVTTYARHEDDVVHGHYYIDIHYPGQGGEATPLEPGRSYGIPYRCLVPRRTDGLLAAGRCLSATPEALGSCRVMAICMAVGQGAGVGAALSVRGGTTPRQVLPAELRRTLLAQHVLLED